MERAISLAARACLTLVSAAPFLGWPGVVAATPAATARVRTHGPAEDAWWQTTARDYQAYLSPGLVLQAIDLPGVPAGASAPVDSVVGPSLSFDWWPHPLWAVDARVALGWGGAAGQLHGGQVSTWRGSARVGIRFSLPIRVTPVVSLNLGYARTVARWTDPRASIDDGSYGGLAQGETRIDALLLTAGGGLEVGYRSIFGSLLVEGSLPLARRIGTRVDRGSRVAEERTGLVTGELGAELRVGLRF